MRLRLAVSAHRAKAMGEGGRGERLCGSHEPGRVGLKTWSGNGNRAQRRASPRVSHGVQAKPESATQHSEAGSIGIAMS